MPTLLAAARHDNIEKSLNAYIQTEIVTGLGIKVWFVGQARSGDLPSQYIEASFVRLGEQDTIVKSRTGGRGGRVGFLVNLNLYLQMDAIRAGTLTRFSQTTTEDDIRELFSPNAAILIRDYNTGGTPIVGALRSSSYPTVFTVESVANTEAGLQQRNLSATLLYFSETLD